MIDPPPMMVDRDHPREYVALRSRLLYSTETLSRVRHIFWSATFTLAVHALPTFVGISAGFAAYRIGSGEIGAIVFGLIAAGFTFAAAHSAVAVFRLPMIRAVIALLFAVPAAVVGYHAVLGLARFAVPAELWQQSFALIGTLAVGGTAWVLLVLSMVPPIGPADRAGCQPLLSAASAEKEFSPSAFRSQSLVSRTPATRRVLSYRPC
jgi:hypothetical protein